MPSAVGPELIKRFDVPDAVYLNGLTVEQAREAMGYCNSLSAKPTPAQSIDLAQKLLGFYSHQKFRTTEAMTAIAAAVAAMLTEISTYAAQRAVHPLTGIPRKLEFISVANVSKELMEEEARYQRITANARWIITQKEAADRQAKEDAEIEASKGTAAQRAARVAELMASLKQKVTDAA